MPTSIRLDARTENLISRLADRKGLTKSGVIRDAIHRLARAEDREMAPRTAHDAMAHVIGCWDSGGARLSERAGEKFRDLLRACRGARHPG